MNPFEMFRSKVAIRDDFSDLDHAAQTQVTAFAHNSNLREARLERDRNEEIEAHEKTKKSLRDARSNLALFAADRIALLNTLEYLRQKWGQSNTDQTDQIFDEAESFREKKALEIEADTSWMDDARREATDLRASVSHIVAASPIGPTKRAAKKAKQSQPG